MGTFLPATPADFKDEWGEGLVPFPPPALADVALADDQKAFLAQAGLPASAPWDLQFGPPAVPLPRLSDDPGAKAVSVDLARLRPIGRGIGTHVCVDEGGHGRVVLVNLAPGLQIPVRLLASSPRQLALFLLLSRDFLENRKLLQDLKRPPKAIQSLVGEFRKDVEQLDPALLKDPESLPAVLFSELPLDLI